MKTKGYAKTRRNRKRGNQFNRKLEVRNNSAPIQCSKFEVKSHEIAMCWIHSTWIYLISRENERDRTEKWTFAGRTEGQKSIKGYTKENAKEEKHETEERMEEAGRGKRKGNYLLKAETPSLNDEFPSHHKSIFSATCCNHVRFLGAADSCDGENKETIRGRRVFSKYLPHDACIVFGYVWLCHLIHLQRVHGLHGSPD